MIFVYTDVMEAYMGQSSDLQMPRRDIFERKTSRKIGNRYLIVVVGASDRPCRMTGVAQTVK